MSLAQLFYLKESFRERMRQHRRGDVKSRSRASVLGPQSSALRSQHFTLEALEPRLLLSATPTEPVLLADLAPISSATTAAVAVPPGAL